MAIFNEFAVLLCAYLYQVFMNPAVEPSFRTDLGKVFIAIGGTSVLVNLIYTVAESVAKTALTAK